jgi:hypothetical protein
MGRDPLREVYPDIPPHTHYAALDQLAPGDRIWLDGAWREVGDAVDTGDGEIVVYYIGTTLGKAIERRFTAPAALLVRRAEQ